MRKQLIINKDGWSLYEEGEIRNLNFENKMASSARFLTVYPKVSRGDPNDIVLINYVYREPYHHQKNIDMIMNDYNCPQEIKNAIFAYLLMEAL